MSADGIDIVPATTAHLDAIMTLERAAFLADAWSRDMMTDEVTSIHNVYSVALLGAALVGYAGLRAPSNAREADVQTIAVAPEARGRGLGRALMERMLTQARDRRMRAVFLEVRADNPVAQGLYHSLGFVELGVRAGYYQPDGVDAVVMRLTLDPTPGIDPSANSGGTL